MWCRAMMKYETRIWHGALAFICGVALAATPVRAGSGSTANLPLPRTKVTTGLNLQVNTEWVDGNGYRQVTVQVKPLGGGAATADRTLDVTLRPRSWQWNVVMPSVSTSITLEQGQTVATQAIAAPQFQTWGSLEIVTYEDGRRCDDLCETVSLHWNGNSVWTEAAPTILFIDSDAPRDRRTAGLMMVAAPKTAKKEKRPEKLPDFRAVGSVFVTDNSNQLTPIDFDTDEAIDDNGLLRLLAKLGRMDIVPPDSMPTSWLQLTAVDVIFVSTLELQNLHQMPERWEALRTWLSTGATLCVYGAGEEFRGIPNLERLFELKSPGEEASDASLDDFVKRGWTAPTNAGYDTEVHATRGVEWNNQWYMQPTAVNATPRNKKTTSGLKPENPNLFLIRAVEQGRLVVFADANPFPGKREEWCWLFNTLNNQDWMWYQRHGMSLHRENPQYWNLLIAGVGDAPVNSFLVLISLFVIVIGPVNYFLLQQRRKLYLLLLTVPLGAGLITSALFLYALVSDGLGVRVRARSLTQINQDNGRTVSWSRQSYYAGLAPSAGMSFPVDAAVYPFDHRPTGQYGQPKDLGRRTYWGSEQRLTQGYLNSRSTSQVMVIESRVTPLGIEVDESASGTDGVQVTNKLGVDIEHLLVHSTDGRSLACDKLPAEQAVQLHEIDADEFSTNWGKLFAAERPAFPVGFDPNQVENASAIFGNSFAWWQQMDRGLPAPSMSTSILERGMRSVGNLKVNALKPRTYIAIVRTAPNVSLGVQGVAEEGSFHVVTGTW